MTLAQDAYDLLRRDIVRGTLAAGQPLRLARLRDRYDVGFSPLREALTRLTAEHLVVFEALRGFQVAPISVEELQDNMQTRIFIETEAVRRAIARGDDEWEAGIVSRLHALKRQAKRTNPDTPEDFDRLERCHYEFHQALLSACGSTRLMEFFATLYTVSERYRVPALRASAGQSGRDLDHEHSALAAAALDRDAETTVQLLTEHYGKTMEVLTAVHRAVA